MIDVFIVEKPAVSADSNLDYVSRKKLYYFLVLLTDGPKCQLKTKWMSLYQKIQTPKIRGQILYRSLASLRPCCLLEFLVLSKNSSITSELHTESVR